MRRQHKGAVLEFLRLPRSRQSGRNKCSDYAVLIQELPKPLARWVRVDLPMVMTTATVGIKLVRRAQVSAKPGCEGDASSADPFMLFRT